MSPALPFVCPISMCISTSHIFTSINLAEMKELCSYIPKKQVNEGLVTLSNESVHISSTTPHTVLKEMISDSLELDHTLTHVNTYSQLPLLSQDTNTYTPDNTIFMYLTQFVQLLSETPHSLWFLGFSILTY